MKIPIAYKKPIIAILVLLILLGVSSTASPVLAVPLESPNNAPLRADTLAAQIAASSDDAIQINTGQVFLTNPVIAMGDDGTNSGSAGLRFANITIPQGVTIVQASLSFTSSGNWSGALTLYLNGHDVGNSPTFSGGNGPVDRQSQSTSAEAAWLPGNWSDGLVYQSPDLTSIIQEIVNRPDWVSGNALSLMVRDDGVLNDVQRRAVAWDSNPAQAAQLNITYTDAMPPDWAFSAFSLDRLNDCDIDEPYNCGIRFTYTVTNLAGDQTLTPDVQVNHVRILDLAGQEFAAGPHPNLYGRIFYDEFPSPAYAEVMACVSSGLFAVVDGGIYGEENTSNNWAVAYLPTLEEGGDIYFPKAPILAYFDPGYHVWPGNFAGFIALEMPITNDIACPPAVLLDYVNRMTVFVEDEEVGHYDQTIRNRRSAGETIFFIYFFDPRPKNNDQVRVEILLNSDEAMGGDNPDNNLCVLNFTYKRPLFNSDRLEFEGGSGCQIDYRLIDSLFDVEGSEDNAASSAGSALTVSLGVVLLAALGGGLGWWISGRIGLPKGGGILVSLVGAALGGVIVIGAAWGLAAINRPVPPEPPLNGEGISVGPPESADGLAGLVGESGDPKPTYCDGYLKTHAVVSTNDLGEIDDLLIQISIPSGVVLPPDSRYRVTVWDDQGATHEIVTEETSISLAAAGLFPGTGDPVQWQVEVETLAGQGGDLYLSFCLADDIHSLTISGGQEVAIDTPTPTTTIIPLTATFTPIPFTATFTSQPPTFTPTPTADTIGPQIKTLSASPPEIFTSGTKPDTTTISATVSDPSGVSSVTLYYKTNLGKYILAGTMTAIGEGVYQLILGPFPTAGTYTFRIIAVDGVGNANCSASNLDACPGGTFMVIIP